MKYDIKIDLGRKNLSKVCKDNSRTAAKDNVTNVTLKKMCLTILRHCEVKG